MIAFCIFAVPSSMVIAPIGAAGTVPLMLAIGLFVLWAASSFLGLHDPVGARHPGRIGLALLLVATSASYVGLYSGWTGPNTETARASADRWIILLLASTALIFVATETLRTINDAMVLVRALLAGGTFCCLVAAVQFFLKVNPTEWIGSAMPGFTYNGGDTAFQNRGPLLRVAGTTFTPIELAVVCSMLLPLSIWRGLYDTVGRKWVHWAGTMLLVFAIAITVSRSGVLGMTVAMAVLIPFMPAFARAWTFVILPVVVSGLFLSIPGLIGTIFAALTPEQGDPSIRTRTNNYPRVEAMFQDRPILGLGPGNYTPTNALHILDNQYLNATVTMGIVGLLGTVAYLALPGVSAFLAARASRAPALKCFAAAVAAAGFVGTVCSLTFDSLSFPVFALAYPLVVGLSGAAWIMTQNENALIDKGESPWIH
jgi:O-antigen ligase